MAVVRIGKKEPGRISVVVPYDPKLVAKIKEVEGRRWHPEEKVWTVSDGPGMMERLLALFAGEKMEVDPALRSIRDIEAGGCEGYRRRTKIAGV
ncbi:MAG: hypothetical protein HY709_01155 [Candidatus Latescibacteria bacterium]|nr:hypothetical protein [Candidatus Latescibacterota bacterium]